MTGEHIFSAWMSKLFPGRTFRFFRLDDTGNIIKQWPVKEIDITAKVVCKECNEGWMSNLEQHHAQPNLADMILGKNTAISPSQARALARFAFKTAVVIDHMRREEPFFFPRSVRHHFAKSLTIPRTSQMWFAGYAPRVSGRVYPEWYEHHLDSENFIKLYACTYGVGHLVFQVVSAQYPPISRSFAPRTDFKHLAIPLWPNIPQGITWPPPYMLRNRAEFERFSERWGNIEFVGTALG